MLHHTLEYVPGITIQNVPNAKRASRLAVEFRSNVVTLVKVLEYFVARVDTFSQQMTGCCCTKHCTTRASNKMSVFV